MQSRTAFAVAAVMTVAAALAFSALAHEGHNKPAAASADPYAPKRVSEATVAAIGLQTAEVDFGHVENVVRLTGLVRPLPDRVQAVAPRIAGVVREARVAWIELDSASRLVEQYRTTVLALSERNLTLAEAALKAGQADVTVLLEAQREVIDARARLTELERQAAIARIDLEYAVGGRLASPPATSHADVPR